VRDSCPVWRSLPACALLIALSAACGPPTLKPQAMAEPDVACPGGWTAWSLEVLDRRAEREASAKVVTLVSDSLTKSFPGCAWNAAATAPRPSILIEINRFAAPFEDQTWNGVADWSVLVRDPGGRTLAEFEAQADVARPNYRDSNNEKEALEEVFHEALRKTVTALRSLPPAR